MSGVSNEQAGEVATAADHPSPQAMRGILMTMAAVSLFVVIDTLSKYLTQYYPVLTVVWARFFFHVAFVVVALGPRLRLSLVRTTRPGAQFARGLLVAAASVFVVSGFKRLPLAECTAIAFLAPLLVTVMAVFFLKEKVELARWIAIVCGFVGVLFIIRPGTGVFSWTAVFPLATAICSASYQIMTRRLAGIESPYTSIFYTGVVGAILFSLTLPFGWVAPQSAFHWFLLALMGCVGGYSHLVLIKAFEHAPAALLAPFSYTQLVWVTFVGYVVFGNFPDSWSLFGIAVLMVSGIYCARHQQLSERARLAELGVGPTGA
jgi:drug/metabolite transporter (DMT)-like permease